MEGTEVEGVQGRQEVQGVSPYRRGQRIAPCRRPGTLIPYQQVAALAPITHLRAAEKRDCFTLKEVGNFAIISNKDENFCVHFTLYSMTVLKKVE